MPNNGISYGILRYLNRQPELENFPQAAIRFNYLGQSDRLFAEDALLHPLSEAVGEMRSPKDKRPCAIEIDRNNYQEQ